MIGFTQISNLFMLNNKLFLPAFLLLQIGLQGCLGSRSLSNALPQGCERINDSLWIDKQPLMNLDYWEYLGWLKQTYGLRSDEFKQAFPDTTGHGASIRGFHSDADPVLQHKTYFVPPERMEEPLQYVTLVQLEAYVMWRSDRVYENMLRKEQLLPLPSKAETAIVFTTKDYLSGNYAAFKPDFKKLPPVPVYTLPSDIQQALSKNRAAKVDGPIRCICSYAAPQSYLHK